MRDIGRERRRERLREEREERERRYEVTTNQYYLYSKFFVVADQRLS